MIDYSTKVCKRGHVGFYDKHRKCRECNRIDSLAKYHANPKEFLIKRKNKRESNLEEFRKKETKYYRENSVKIGENAKKRRIQNPAREMFNQAKIRARKGGYPFTININDIIIPKICPLLNIELKVNEGKVGANSPTLDKIIPALGYVPGNIIVISHKANAIKNNATLEEMKTLVTNWENLNGN